MRAGRYTGIKNLADKKAGSCGRRLETGDFLQGIFLKYRLCRSWRSFPALYYLRYVSRIMYEYRFLPAGGDGASKVGLPKDVYINTIKNHLGRLAPVQNYNLLQPVSNTKSGLNFIYSFYQDWWAGGASPAGVMADSVSYAGANSFAQNYICSNKFGARAPCAIKIAPTSLKFSSSAGAVSETWMCKFLLPFSNGTATIHQTKENLVDAGMGPARPFMERFLLAPVFPGILPSGRRPQAMGKMKKSQTAEHLRHLLPETADVEHHNVKNPVAARTGLRGVVLEQPEKLAFKQVAGELRVIEPFAGYISLPAPEPLLHHRSTGTAEKSATGLSYAGGGKTFYPPVRMDVPKGQYAAKEAVRDQVKAAGLRQVSKDGAADRPGDFLMNNNNRLHRLETREDLNRFADRVYSLIERRIRIERERRGKPCW